MKSLNSKMRKKLFRQTVGDEVMKAAEIYDLTMLWTIRERYYCDGDEEKFGSRTDAYVIKERLKEIGFDYDKEVKEMTDDERN